MNVMGYDVVLPIWKALRDRFQDKVKKVSEEQFQLQLDNTTVVDLLYHTAEVEYKFSEWFFASQNKKEIIKPTDKSGYIQLLQQSNEHFMLAMKELPEEKWNQIQQSAFGNSTPLEAVGRLMNHAGMHSGQITYIIKYGKQKEQ